MEHSSGISRPRLLLALPPFVFCILAYGFALNGPLFFDDLPNVTENPYLKFDGATFDHWREAALSSNAGLFKRPLAMLTFAANSVVAGELTAFSLKATNLAIHLILAVLIYFFARGVMRSPAVTAAGFSARHAQWIAMTATVLWLLHHNHVSTVLYAVQRMAQMSALFVLGGLVYYLRVRLRWAEAGGSAGEIIAAALWLALFTLAATLGKENGALLPLMVLALEATLFRGAWDGEVRRGLARLAWCLLLFPVAVIALVLLFSPETLASRFGDAFSLEERLLTQLRVLWTYLSLLFVPNVLQMGFFHDDIPLSTSLLQPWTTTVALLAWVGVTATAVALRERLPLLLFALVFFLAGHLMESTVLPLQIAFEHRNYLPSVSIMVLLASGLVQLGARVEGLKPYAVPGVYAVLLLVMLAIRIGSWRDEVTLARFNVINHSESPRANFFYGNALFKQFTRAQELGLSAEEQQALAVASRNYFETMHLLAPEDFPALVMLYQLDSEYFPQLAIDNDWLAKMELLVQHRRLTTSDRTALGALNNYGMRRGGADLARVAGLVEVLLARDPWRADLLAMRFRYLRSQGVAGDEQLRRELQHVIDNYPGSFQAAAYLTQLSGEQDLDTTYEALREWMQRDAARTELSRISRIFRN